MSRILFLSRWFPYPPNNGSRLRVYNLLQILKHEHEITLLTFADSAPHSDQIEALEATCQAVHVIPWQGFSPTRLTALLGFFSRRPRSIVDTHSPEMQRHIEEIITSSGVELVIASEVDMAAYYPFFAGLPALFEEAEVGVLYDQYVQAQTPVRRIRKALMWYKMQRYLRRLLDAFDACTVVSETEKRLWTQLAPTYHAIEVVPNCLQLEEYNGNHGRPGPNTLIYSGSLTYFANYNAMVWFLDEIFPRIREKLPDVTLTITGDHADLPLPVQDNVNLTGMVADVRPLIASSWASLAPIRDGGGTRLKILEAMALHTPVIATTKGAEGLPVKDGKHILIADTPQAFAESTVRLLTDPELRKQLSDQAYRLVADSFDWKAVSPKFLDLVRRLVRSETLPAGVQ